MSKCWLKVSNDSVCLPFMKGEDYCECWWRGPITLWITAVLPMLAVWIVTFGHRLFTNQHRSTAKHRQIAQTSCRNEAEFKHTNLMSNVYAHMYWISILNLVWSLKNACVIIRTSRIYVSVHVHTYAWIVLQWLQSKLWVLPLNQRSKDASITRYI